MDPVYIGERNRGVAPAAQGEFEPLRIGPLRLDAPVVLAAHAIRDWLQARNITRVALLSPYPDWLNVPAVDYWTRQGFDVTNVRQVAIGSDNTDRIYALSRADIQPHIDALLASDAEGFLVSGTGMPALFALEQHAAAGRPVLSSNSALADRAIDLAGPSAAK